MRAAILAVGSELLGTDRLDTNSLRLAEVLERHGVGLTGKSVVGDAEGAIADEVRHRLQGVELLLVTGGLGPTADDVTRPGVARALGLAIAIDEEVAATIAARFADYGMRMPEVNRRQAEMIEGAEPIANRHGSAPGMRIDVGAGAVFLFPGVPVELEGMIGSALEPWLAARSAGDGRERGFLKVSGLPESRVEERIAPAYDEFGRESISVLAKAGEVLLQFWAAGSDEERRQRLAEISRRLRELVGPAIFTDDPDEDLAATVGALLRRRGESVATAESCTGGWLGQRITAVPEASGIYPGGVVTYSNRAKQELLGVDAGILAAHGAVSEPVARAMAVGIRRLHEATYGLAITGVAGPGGGSEDKPVGTVHVALALPPSTAGADEAGGVVHRRVRLAGDRERVRWMSTGLALEMLRRHLLSEAEAGNDEPTVAGSFEAASR
ncbi:MAG TPA: CinA family nicotinamide mononucleotide deamidase-related protein [Thermoanaerobaculia bacterium]|nr:CinA family nicotinamide mononucleotide deamidase-related protein [Thermoanaerobaculia bacterium]